MKDLPKHIAIQVFSKAWFKSSPPDLNESRFCIKQDDQGRLKIIYNGTHATIIDEFLNIFNAAGRDEQRDVYHQGKIKELLRNYQMADIQTADY